MLNIRRRRVLQALVEEYISSAVPVGSRTLVERYELGCSPATVRNELSILEETGFLAQPHVSAGRIPTDSGYRSFVDDLLEHEVAHPTAAVEQARFHRIAEVDELLRETSAALTKLTNCLAITVAPSVASARVKRIDLLSMAPRRVLFLLITATGQVVNRSIEIPEEVAPERLAQIERALNASVVEKRANEISPLRDALQAQQASGDVAVTKRVVDEILDALAEADRDRLHHVGVTSLLSQPEFHEADRARPLITFLEDGITVLETLSEVMSSGKLTIRIGHENGREELGNVSIVATPYSAGSAEGVIGVVGPTRMDYQRAIGAVRSVADALSDAMGGE